MDVGNLKKGLNSILKFFIFSLAEILFQEQIIN